MIERFDNPEQANDGAEEFDETLQRNFRPADNTPGPVEKLTLEEESIFQDKQELQHQARLGNKWQGDIGEGVTLRIASEKLDLTPDPRFDQPYHGLDGVYKDKQGKLVLVESKLTDHGINSLNNDQMQPEWVERKARLMQTLGTKQYSPGNAEIGAEIQRLRSENIRRLVIAINPSSLEAHVYEGQENRGWKLIETWDVYNIDQPYL